MRRKRKSYEFHDLLKAHRMLQYAEYHRDPAKRSQAFTLDDFRLLPVRQRLLAANNGGSDSEHLMKSLMFKQGRFIGKRGKALQAKFSSEVTNAIQSR